MTEWILPSSPKEYRTDDVLRDLGAIEWFQSKSITNLQIGDVVFIYISTPVQEIHWKCQVTDVKRMVSKIDDSAYYNYDTSLVSFSGPFVELKAIYEFTLPDLVSFQMLKQNGLKNRLMGPCRVNAELSTYLSSVEAIQQDDAKVTAHVQSLPLKALQTLAKKHAGIPAKKQATVGSYARNPYIAQYAKARANGLCQLCGMKAPFICANGEPYLESHHVDWLSKGGMDSIDNTVALCPNCHKKMHVINDKNDIARLKQVLSSF